MLTSLFVYFWAVFNDLDNIPLVPVKGSQDLGDFMFSLCWVSSKKLFYLQFILVIFLFFFQQVPIYFSCLCECCTAICLRTSRDVLWTAKLPVTLQQHEGDLHF